MPLRYPTTSGTLLEKIAAGDGIGWDEFYEKYAPVAPECPPGILSQRSAKGCFPAAAWNVPVLTAAGIVFWFIRAELPRRAQFRKNREKV